MISKAGISALLLLISALPGVAQQKSAKPVVEFDTTMGIIRLELNPAKAPITAKNFLDYVNSGFYNGTIVHRVDSNVIGLGGYTENLTGKMTRPAIKNESRNGLKNLRGTISMARFDPPNSATSQFFINLQDNTYLDATGNKFGYAVFGKVVQGMDVVDKIAKVSTGAKGAFTTLPVKPIVVRSAKVVSK